MSDVLSKQIAFFGQRCILACDGNCAKAWGISSRPKRQLSDDPDDFFYIGDGDLGDAPTAPGTYEGGFAKPSSSEERLNNWCARECERSAILGIGEPIELPDMCTPEPNIRNRWGGRR